MWRINGYTGKLSRTQGILRHSYDGREPYVLAILLTVVSCTSGIVLYLIDRHTLLYFGDAVSHLVRAREFFDSQRPGFHNIGTVWLPLPHLILLPLVAFDTLFYSGIAGPIVGIPCLVGTGVLTFFIVRRITGSRAIAFVSGCILGLNPNLVYMALTPMNEPILIVLVAFGGYAFLRWSLGDGEFWLGVCAGCIVLASLCRYEAWFIVPFVSIVSALKGISLWQHGRRGVGLRSVAIAGVCWAGIVIWICWNFSEYGDPLKFARWTYAVAPGAAHGYLRLPPLNALLIFGEALLVIFGPVILLTASGSMFPLRPRPSHSIPPGMLLLFFGLPAIFALVAIVAGFVQIDQWRWNWRYVLTASPFLAVAAGIGFSEFCHRVRSPLARSVAVASLLAMPLVQIGIPSVGIATFDDARRSVSDNTRFAITLGEQLQGISSDGSIALLTGYSQAHRIMITSGLPLKQFRIIYSSAEGDMLGSVLHSEHYLVIGKERTAESEKFVNGWLSRRGELLSYYTIRLENDHYILLERRSTPPRF